MSLPSTQILRASEKQKGSIKLFGSTRAQYSTTSYVWTYGRFEGYLGLGGFSGSMPRVSSRLERILHLELMKSSTPREDDPFSIDDADPEDGDADIDAALYSGSGSGSGGRASVAGFSPADALRLGPPLSLLTESHVPASPTLTGPFDVQPEGGSQGA